MIRPLFWLSLYLICIPKFALAAEFEREQIVFGNVNLRVQIKGDLTKKEAFKLMEKAFKIAKVYDATFSSYREDSELVKINQMVAKQKPQKLSRRMAKALKIAESMRIKTNGSFDAGYETPNVERPIYRINKQHELIYLETEGRINPTGLIKGLYVDEVTEKLLANHQVKSVMVAASGDIRVASKDNSGRVVLLENPNRPSHRQHVLLKNEAISTSGEYHRGHHLVNTGKGKGRALQVSVRANDCLTSDTLDTALFYLDIEAIHSVLKNFPAVEVYMLEKKDGYKLIHGKHHAVLPSQ
jgi:thiamine biosynthesis lipoprotein